MRPLLLEGGREGSAESFPLRRKGELLGLKERSAKALGHFTGACGDLKPPLAALWLPETPLCEP